MKGKEARESEGKERVVFEWCFGREGCEKGSLLGFGIAFFAFCRWKWTPKYEKAGRTETRRGRENNSTCTVEELVSCQDRVLTLDCGLDLPFKNNYFKK